MALVGGGGAPNVAGSNPPGIGSSLNFIGDHCYAVSGEFGASTSEQTMLSFKTSGLYVVATLTMTAPIRFADLANGQTRGFKLSFNSEVVGMYKAESAQEDMPADVEVTILIPPFTQVELVCKDTNDASTFTGTANITGRVYA